MNTHCAMGNYCWIWSIVYFLVWWVGASGLIFFTWNRVIAAHFKVKQAQFWQALLLLFTLVTLVAPCSYLRKGSCHGHQGHCQTGHCHTGMSHMGMDKADGDYHLNMGVGTGHGDCPYSNSRREQENSAPAGEAKK